MTVKENTKSVCTGIIIGSFLTIGSIGYAIEKTQRESANDYIICALRNVGNTIYDFVHMIF